MKVRNKQQRPRVILIAVFGLLLVLGCVLAFVASEPIRRQLSSSTQVSPTDQSQATLTLAYSPEKGALIKSLIAEFNASDLRTADRQKMRVELVELSPEEMVTQALSGQQAFQALTPDSSLWLDQLNRRWAQSQAALEPGTIEPRLFSEPLRYAVTPIVIAAWEDTARSLGWPDRPVSWSSLQARAQQDSAFKWSHPSTAHASGLLATLAEFYAGAGVQRGLTAELAQDPKTVEFVTAVEKTVRYYGEGELAVAERAAAEGPSYLDAFVVSEQIVVALNSGAFGAPPARLVALYPAEGTLWADHPLALLETRDLTVNQRRTFQALSEFLTSAESQREVLLAGYRPSDLTLAIDGSDSPLSGSNGANPAEPQTTLQLPTSDVVAVVQNVWALTKRKTNVYLVVDTSGSMQGEKLESARSALQTFLAQITSDQEQVGMVEFNTSIANIVELERLSNNRAQLVREINGLQAGGNTALLDAVQAAYLRLQSNADGERINAIVAMTDGRENASSANLSRLVAQIRDGNRDLPIVIFCVAYGRDADYEVLRAIAEASGGQVREGTTETIRDLYKILSSYF
jgi:Ca-activated chloride channel family protein